MSDEDRRDSGGSGLAVGILVVVTGLFLGGLCLVGGFGLLRLSSVTPPPNVAAPPALAPPPVSSETSDPASVATPSDSVTSPGTSGKDVPETPGSDTNDPNTPPATPDKPQQPPGDEPPKGCVFNRGTKMTCHATT